MKKITPNQPVKKELFYGQTALSQNIKALKDNIKAIHKALKSV